MLSLQRSSNHPPALMPWFAQSVGNPTKKSGDHYWIEVPAGPVNNLTSTCSSASSSTASTTNLPQTRRDPYPSFYPCQNEVNRPVQKQTRSTLRTISSHGDLNLPSDPRSWLREDVQTWIRYMSEAHGIPKIDCDRFLMNGKALCLMTIDMFCQRVPLGGKMLYKDFQLRLSMAMYNS